jgi:hypothetical protein
MGRADRGRAESRADVIALEVGNAREVGLEIGRTMSQVAASQLGRSGNSLGAALAQINGTFGAQFDGSGALSGFANLDRSNPMYAQQFMAQRAAFTEARAGAFQSEGQRQVLHRGEVNALKALTDRDATKAGVTRLMAQRDALQVGATFERVMEIQNEFNPQIDLLERDAREGRDLRNRAMTGDIAEMEMRFGPARTGMNDRRRGRPMAANALGIFNSAMEDNQGFLNAGESGSARNALLLGQQSLIGLKNQLIDNPLFGGSIATSSPFAVDFTGGGDKPPKEDLKAALTEVERLLRDIEKKL